MDEAREAYGNAYRALRLLAKLDGGDTLLPVLMNLLPPAHGKYVRAAQTSFEQREVEDRLWELHRQLLIAMSPTGRAVKRMVESFAPFRPGTIRMPVMPVVRI